MTSTPHTVPASAPAAARRTTPAAGGSQWWKAWLLLTSLGATALGSMALPQDEPQPAGGIGATQVPAPTEQVRVMPVRAVQASGNVARSPAGAPALRAIPRRPVFRTPVTRTRRS
ncbi:MAG: hypothetical protein ABL982_08490 [Vicinamibacterales bacterium]